MTLPAAALDDRLGIVGTAGSGKTYAAKGLVERLLDSKARVCIVDPLGVWWGLRSGANGRDPGFPIIVFGGQHGDVPLSDTSGDVLGRLIGERHLSAVVDLSELGSAAARRRFMVAFAEALHATNRDPLHLVLDEADLWVPQRPMPDQTTLLNRIDEIVRRGRVRGFIPWLITQRPAVIHKDVLSQIDVLIAMKLTSSQDRAAIGGWIEGQADVAEGKRILAALPRLPRGHGVVWAPGRDLLAEMEFPTIVTFDSSRTPKRGETMKVPTRLAEVDISELRDLLQREAEPEAAAPGPSRGAAATQIEAARKLGYEQALVRARALGRQSARQHVADAIAIVEDALARLRALQQAPADGVGLAPPPSVAQRPEPALARPRTPPARSSGSLHAAARAILSVLVARHPARFTWSQAATLAGLKARGGHFNAGRQELRAGGYLVEDGDTISASENGLAALGDEVRPTPASASDLLDLWCSRLPSPAPEMLRWLAQQSNPVSRDALAAALGKAPRGGHWNAGLSVLRTNGLIVDGRDGLSASELFRELGR